MFRFYSNPINGTRVAIVGIHSEGVLKLAAARCSKRDEFRRAKGRAIAEGRLQKNKLYSSTELSIIDVNTFVRIAEVAAIDIANNPKRVSINI